MMSDVESRLRALGASLELPPAPDVVPMVLARLPARPRRRRPGRRALAVALAASLLLASGAMAVSPTRDAILRILGLRSVSIVRVPRLPALPPGAHLGLGQRIALSRARRAAGFRALLPPGATAAYLGRDVPGGRISLLVGRVLITEFRGTPTPFVFKIIGPGTAVKAVRVNDGPGAYLSGAPHQVLFQTQSGEVRTDRVRLAGNALIWQQGSLTVRIEGIHTLAQGVAMARSLR